MTIHQEDLLIGCLLYADDYEDTGDYPWWATVGAIIERNDLQRHRRVWDAMVDVIARGEALNVVTVDSALVRAGTDQPGDLHLLGTLSSGRVSHHQLPWVARRIKEASQQLGISRAVSELEGATSLDVGARLDKVRASLDQIEPMTGRSIAQHAGKDACLYAGQVAEDVIEGRPPSGLLTGFDEVDAFTLGLHPGDFTVFAARPAMGKTAFATSVLLNIAKRDKNVLMVSLEMSEHGFSQRLLAMQSGVPVSAIRAHDLDHRRLSALGQAGIKLAQWPIKCVYSAYTWSAIRMAIINEHAHSPLSVACIDYLQLAEGEDGRKNRQEQVATISRGVKKLAGQLGIPIIALAQLNRGVEARDDKRPKLSDLRESGAIEQDADVVQFLYREEQYDPDTSERGIAEVITSKNRQGPCGTAKIGFEGPTTRFRNL